MYKTIPENEDTSFNQDILCCPKSADGKRSSTVILLLVDQHSYFEIECYALDDVDITLSVVTVYMDTRMHMVVKVAHSSAYLECFVNH